jgi:hypothetical protein
MSAWGKSDNKSSSGGVALSAPSITFNAATGHAAGVYTSAGHPFQLGDPVAYANGGGTSVVGLTSGSTYYVTNVTANTFMLASTEDRALRNVPEVITSTDGIGASHTFTLPLALGRGTLTGTETEFETELLVGDIVRASTANGSQEMIAIAVTSDTLATVINANPGTTLTAFSNDEDYRIHEKPTSVASVATTDFESTQVFGVARNEIHGDQQGGYVSAIALIQGGARYLEVPGVTVSASEDGDTAEGTATISGGVVTAITVTDRGDGYEAAPTVAIAKPKRTIPTTAVTIAEEKFTYATHGLVAGESVKYFNGGGASITGLVDNTAYFVSALGFTTGLFRLAASESAAAGRAALAGVAISGTGGQFTCTATTLAAGDRIRITGTLGGTGTISGYATDSIYTVSAVTGTSPSVTGFTLTTEDGSALTTTTGTPTGLTYTPFTLVLISGTGNNAQFFEIQTVANQATANAALGVNQGIDEAESGAVAHTGWVHRKVLTGRHAGRIQYEVLVALSKNGITGDAGDDTAFPED